MNLLRAVHATEARIAAENLPNLDARVNDWRERVQSGLGSVVSVVFRSVTGRTRTQGDSSGGSDKSSASPARRTTRTTYWVLWTDPATECQCKTNAAVGFHCDMTADVVGFSCLEKAAEGGASRLA